MPVGELHHVVVSVRDMDLSLAFYEGHLGLRRTLDTVAAGAQTERLLGLSPGTVGRTVYVQGPTRLGQIELVEWSPRPEGPPAREAGDLGVVVLSFELPRDEIRDLHAQLADAGVTCRSEPEEVPLPRYGTIVAFVCEDPDGNLVEFVSLPTREQIERARQEGAS